MYGSCARGGIAMSEGTNSLVGPVVLRCLVVLAVEGDEIISELGAW